ncbi:MAG: cysteine desulfurase NifS [Acidobacteriota bacterium]
MRIYLDNNATTQVEPEVLEAMLPCFREVYGNASSVHRFGQDAKDLVDEARRQVAHLINAEPDEIVFTSGGTEADNLAVRGVIDSRRTRSPHIITSQIEHHAILNTCRALEKEGVKVTYLAVDSEGIVDPEGVRRAITAETALISIMFANNEIGTIQPIREIGKIAREHSILFHCDAVQAAGKIGIDTRTLNVDLLSLSGHKFHAPKGVGALYVRKGTRLSPLFRGGTQERRRRAGTENVPGIVGLGKAAELAYSGLTQSDTILNLRAYFESEVLNRIDRVHVNGALERRVPNTSNLRFDHVESEGLVINLDLEGIAVSTGSACSSGAIEPSHVLMALGLPIEKAFNSVRFSLSKYTTREEIDYVLTRLPGVVQRLRTLYPTRTPTVAVS